MGFNNDNNNNNKNKRTKAFTESVLIATIMTIYILLGLSFIPIIAILYPIPFVVLGIKNGIKHNILSILASSIVVGILTDPYTGAFILLIFGPLSIVLTYLIKKKRSSQHILVITTIVSLISYLIAIQLLGKVLGIDFVNQMDETFRQVMKMQIDTMKGMGLSKYELYKTEGLLKDAFDYMILILPSMFILFSMFTAYLNFLISSSVLKRLGYKEVNIPKISYFRLPGSAILGTIAMFLGSWLLKKFGIFYHETIFINVTMFVAFIFFLQGLAVILYLLNRTKLSRVLKTIIMVVIVILIPLGGFISLLGLLDVIFNFRRI
ncbi:MAG TPA: YybS family protein [Tissierellales bacterium]|nr:YybS family protein [Tissierellales bacterium]